MYECYRMVYARFNEETAELILVDSEKTLIEFILDQIREELLQYGTVSVKMILYWIGDYNAREAFDDYIIDNVDEFDGTLVKRHRHGYISNEYIATIQGIKRAP